MSFDVRDELNRAGVIYVSEGRNVARDHVNIQCPMCGPSDPSEHMGIRLEDGAWACWRDPKHRGRSFAYLLSLITGERRDEIAKRLEEGSPAPPLGDLASMCKDMLDRAETGTGYTVETLEYEQGFKPIKPCGSAAPFYRYLLRRGFGRRDVLSVAKRWGLRAATRGRFARRLIIPVRLQKHGMVGWTARAIGDATMRYLAHPTGSAVRYGLFAPSGLRQGGHTLVVCEGALDAMMLDTYGGAGVRAVAIGGTAPSIWHLHEIGALSRPFARVLVVFDRDAAAQSLDAVGSLLAWVGRPVVSRAWGGPGKDPADGGPEGARDARLTD